MDKNIQDVKNAGEATSEENASAPETKPGVEIKPEETTSNPPAPVDEKNEAVSKELRSLESALKKAEDAIVKQKRENEKLRKQVGRDYVPEDNSELKEKVAQLEEEIATLKTSSEKDETLEELARARIKTRELAAALIAQKTAGTAGGSNQDKLAKDENRPKLSAEDMVVVRQAARRRGISDEALIKEWHKAGKI